MYTHHMNKIREAILSTNPREYRIEFIEKWIAALESGDYEQTTGKLKSDTGYCCLGVLCDISGDGTWKKSEKKDTYLFVGKDGRERYDMPPEYTFDNWVMGGGRASSIAEILSVENDTGASFKKIALILRDIVRTMKEVKSISTL